ncbi:hypothetical protein LTR85_010080 [Meristemomyces frigidus]|nr:hypothetical protein LTR85_010080 [Meristemomyces frigidus]
MTQEQTPLTQANLAAHIKQEEDRALGHTRGDDLSSMNAGADRGHVMQAWLMGNDDRLMSWMNNGGSGTLAVVSDGRALIEETFDRGNQG